MSANSFLEREKVTKVKNKYLTTFHKVDELEQTLGSYLPLTGGTLTGPLIVTDYININNDSSKITANSGSFALGNLSSVGNGYLKFGPASINNDANYLHLNAGPIEIISNNSKIFDLSHSSGSLLSVGFKLEQGAPLFYSKSLNDRIQITQNAGFIDNISAYLFGPGQLISISQGVENSTQFVSHYSGYGQMWFKGSEPKKSSYNLNIGGSASYFNMSTVDSSDNTKSNSLSINLYTNTGSFIEAENTYNYHLHEDTTLYTSRINFNSWIQLSRKSNKTALSNSFETTICSNYVTFGGISDTTDNDGIYNKYYYKFGPYDAIFSAVGNSNTSPRLDTQGKYGIKFNLGYTSDLGIRVINQQNENKRNFTITGFSNIVNDKFTLSDTYDTSALTETLTQDEIDWIDSNSKDILALIMDIKRSGSGTDVVTRAEYNDLLEKYNDLAERLNIFLQNTGNIPLEPTGNALKTKALNTTQLSIRQQNADDDFTIDWGDGTTDLSGSNGTIINHNYAETDNYTIQIIPNNDNAIGEIIYSVDDILEIYFQDKVKLDDEYVFDSDDVLKKIVIDNALLYWGSNSGFILHSTSIEEVHVGKNCTYIPSNLCFILDCSALTKLTIDMPIVDYEGSFIDDCPNLIELHLTSTTMPTFINNGSLFGTIPDDLVIYVPNALLNDYKTALPDYATYIIGE